MGAIKIKHGVTIEVYRGGAHGIDSDGPLGSLIGTIPKCVISEAKTVRQTGFRAGGVNDTRSSAATAVKDIFAPRHTALQLENGDHFKVGGYTYRVTGTRNLDLDHPMSGLDFGYYVMQCEVTA